MGNHHSHGGGSKKGSIGAITVDAADSATKDGLSRSSSGADVQDNFPQPVTMSPVDRLAKVRLLPNTLQFILLLRF